MDLEMIAERRRAIEDDARCIGCSATLALCKANRGKDPSAPAWFGCCARGTAMAPCHHVPDYRALLALLREIEGGKVRSVEEVLLDSLDEHSGTLAHLRRLARQIPPDEMLQLAHPASHYEKEEFS